MDAKQKEFPHMALIGYALSQSDDDYLCGGTLISTQFVLSAAHCLFHRELLEAKYVKLGDVKRNVKNSNTYTYSIVERIPHPSYKHDSIDHNIALFKLNETLILKDFRGFVRPICLPYKVEHPSKVIAIGFGFDEVHENGSYCFLLFYLIISF